MDFSGVQTDKSDKKALLGIGYTKVSMKYSKEKREEAFTIIEIMVVTLIIGVLTAISVPLYSAHKKMAVKATLISDVRNAAMEMEKAEVFSKTGFGAAVPDSFFASNMNHVVILPAQSSDKYYCLRGSTANYPDMFVYYNYATRKLITEGTINNSQCGDNNNATGEIYNPSNPGAVAGEVVTKPSPEVTQPPVPDPSPNPTTPGSTGTPTSPPGAVSPVTVIPFPQGYDDPNRTKFDICHNGNMISPALSGIINGHDGHPDDIIPPIPGIFYPGKNWDAAGSELWHNGCDNSDTTIPVPMPTTPSVTPTPTPTTSTPAKIPAPTGYNDPKAKKFAICHNGNMISPALSGVVNGHAGHDDDIIPPIPGYFPEGINWDATGSAIWYANCKGQK